MLNDLIKLLKPLVNFLFSQRTDKESYSQVPQQGITDPQSWRFAAKGRQGATIVAKFVSSFDTVSQQVCQM